MRTVLRMKSHTFESLTRNLILSEGHGIVTKKLSFLLFSPNKSIYLDLDYANQMSASFHKMLLTLAQLPLLFLFTKFLPILVTNKLIP